MKHYDTIVVGGGLAGLSASAYLAKAGAAPLLIEKENLGGLVGGFTQQGFTFDTGISSLENQGILFPFLDSLEIEMEFIKTPVSMGFKDRWVTLDTHESLEDYFHLLRYYFPENERDIDNIENLILTICKNQKVIGEIDNPLLLDEKTIKNPKYLFSTLLPWLWKHRKNQKVLNSFSGPAEIILKNYTNSQALIDMIIQHFFANTPAVFALSYFNMYQDYYYPKGGTAMLPKELQKKIFALGGEILEHTRATQVNHREKALQTTRGSFSYENLIWAADQKTLYNIIFKKNSSIIKKEKQIKLNKGTDSVFTVWAASTLTEKEVNFIGPHAFYTPCLLGLSSIGSWKKLRQKDRKNLFNWVEKYLERTTYEISIPVLRDSTLAPENYTGLIISTLFDYELTDYIRTHFNYDSFKIFVEEKILRIIEDNLLPKLSESLLFAWSATPLTLEKRTGNFQGAVSGWEFNENMPSETALNQMTRAVKTPFDSIYQAGQWTFSPAGIPVSILTGKLAADEVLKK